MDEGEDLERYAVGSAAESFLDEGLKPLDKGMIALHTREGTP
jgi:hypothetical protein